MQNGKYSNFIAYFIRFLSEPLCLKANTFPHTPEYTFVAYCDNISNDFYSSNANANAIAATFVLFAYFAHLRAVNKFDFRFVIRDLCGRIVFMSHPPSTFGKPSPRYSRVTWHFMLHTTLVLAVFLYQFLFFVSFRHWGRSGKILLAIY